MKTTSLDLEFLDDKGGGLPHPAIARVYVKTYSQATNDGPPLITPDCVTPGELDVWIDHLRLELEAIRQKAKTKFGADNRRQLGSP